MAALAWLVAPGLADRFAGGGNVPLAKALFVSLTIGLVWQFVLVAVLVGREQRTFRWSTIREALWLRSPRSPRSGRVGGRVWLILIPLIVALAAEELIPRVALPENRDMGTLLESDAGQAFLDGAWGWYGLLVAMWLFNTVLGEELLFRGFLLPRMNGAFGRGDWERRHSRSRRLALARGSRLLLAYKSVIPSPRATGRRIVRPPADRRAVPPRCQTARCSSAAPVAALAVAAAV